MKYWIIAFLMASPAFAGSKKVLVISGMTSEANIAKGRNVITVVSGNDPVLLQSRLAQIDPTTIRAVISFGVAGGLAPDARAGDILVASSVSQNGVSYATDPWLFRKILNELNGYPLTVQGGALTTTDIPIYAAADKLSLGRMTGALADDIESATAARWAAANRLPFAAVRSISDPQEFTLPPAARQAINADGSTNVSEVWSSLMQDPSQFGALIQTAIYSEQAMTSLRWCSQILHFGNI